MWFLDSITAVHGWSKFDANQAAHNTCPSSHDAGPVAEAQQPVETNCFICTDDANTMIVSKFAKSRNQQHNLEVL